MALVPYREEKKVLLSKEYRNLLPKWDTRFLSKNPCTPYFYVRLLPYKVLLIKVATLAVLDFYFHIRRNQCRLSYSKGNSKEVGEKFYLEKLIRIITVQPNHLNLFQDFFSVIKSFRKSLDGEYE